ncbi:ribonuclease H family protein [Brevibacterium spongiae]|uniref:Ribonuclease H n=1 Tax=Brevibacterium spongiae TaxID=2909672 RepID=A0ABY5SIQ8_9MICO|nr:ribonuclease H [Brevibacterium spongiae]UVI34437.1 ribonuclease HI [Brevibacterium spongiae]
MTIIAAADGSALGNPGPAGWAWYIDDDCWHAGGWKNATNNRGELMAVLDLLNSTADADEDLKVFCDSQYVINALTKWMPGWKRKGWKKADGMEVLNKDLLELLDAALKGRDVEFEWVKGHSNHAMNEAADDRARAAATAYQKGTAVPEGPGYVPAGTPEALAPAAASGSADAAASEAEDAGSASTVAADAGSSSAGDGSATTVVSTRVPTHIADELVARAKARGVHPQEFLAELIGRSLETE